MKKRGKYEKIPQAQAKVRAEKTILHTYVTSLLSLVLCVTMFFGTSFAWFTSEVTNTENEIYIGTLDVGLFKETIVDGATKTIDLSEKDTKLFDGNIRWEPGYTTLETIKIVNEGDLAFNYVLNFIETPATTEENGAATQSEETEKLDIKTVAENFDVWVCEHSGEDAPTPKSYKEVTEDSKWKYAGSLKALLSGDFVLNGVMELNDVRDTTQTSTAANEGPTDSKATEHTYTIALHMKEETNDPALMGYKISLNVKLIAYQMVSEQDDLGGNHDELTPVSDAEGLKAALENPEGSNVLLTADVDLGNAKISIPAEAAVILDLNGHKITGAADSPISLITNNGKLTIIGKGEIALTFNGNVDNSIAANTISNRGVLTVNDGNISNTGVGDQIGYAIDNYNGATLTVNGGKITASGSSYYDGIRLFCGGNETVVTVNGGEISTIWAQNPSDGKATEVKGTVIVNGGKINTVYYENYTTVRVAEGVVVTVTPYGAGSDNSTTTQDNGYIVYSFGH